MFFEYASPTTLVSSGCTLRVIVQIEYIDCTGLDTDVVNHIVDCWFRYAEEIWANRLDDDVPAPTWMCRDVVFEFLVRRGPTPDCPSPCPPEKPDSNDPKQYHRLILKSDLDGNATTHLPTDTEPRAYGTWDINESVYVVAHECGHLLGLWDEYDKPDTELWEQPPDTPYHNDSEWPRCLMMTTASSIVVAPDHVKTILTNLGASNSFLCCSLLRPIRLIRAIWQWLRRGPPLPPPAPVPTPWQPPDPGDHDLASAVFTAIDAARGPELARIANWVGEKSRFRVDYLIEDVLLREGASRKVRWLAVIALQRAEGDSQPQAAEALLTAVEDTEEDISVRMLAARSLHKLGIKNQRATQSVNEMLVGALASHSFMIRHPAILVRVYADRLLRMFTEANVGFPAHASEVARKQGIQRWMRQLGLLSQAPK